MTRPANCRRCEPALELADEAATAGHGDDDYAAMAGYRAGELKR